MQILIVQINAFISLIGVQGLALQQRSHKKKKKGCYRTKWPVIKAKVGSIRYLWLAILSFWKIIAIYCFFASTTGERVEWWNWLLGAGKKQWPNSDKNTVGFSSRFVLVDQHGYLTLALLSCFYLWMALKRTWQLLTLYICVVFVAQLVERSLPTSEIHGSNPNIRKNLSSNCSFKKKIK